MTDRTQWIHSIVWRNPYTTPPDNLPIKLLERTGQPFTAEEIKAVYPDYRLGCGYSHCIDFPAPARRTMSAATRKRMQERRQKTQEANRLRKHLPLLAEVIIKEEGLDWRAEQ